MDNFDGAQTERFLRECKERGKTTFLDVCWDAKGRWGELLDSCMPYIDYFMPSIDEAVCIAGKEDPEEIADVFMAKGVKNVVIKLGSKGSYLKKSTDKAGTVYESYRVENPVDTTGAGDTFCSGFLAAYARGLDASECMPFANAAGALSVMAKGATAGTRSYEETLNFINERKAR
jgi:sugar/nucleoside kinase (ribokinase family)